MQQCTEPVEAGAVTRTASLVFIGFAALLLALATALGAAGSHALESALDADALTSFMTAVEYQFFHALGLMGLAIYAERRPESRLLTLAALLLLVGIALFCGGVYTSSLGGPRWISGLAPAGGICLIVGWLVMAASVLQSALGDGRQDRD
jgi:uncharacterized membrane protein YgdD (TMEM256/DUF423 family)